MADDVGSLLLRAGLVEPDQLDRARSTAKRQGGTVPEELVRLGHIGDEALTSFYRTRLLIPRVSPSELTRLTAGLLEKVPADMATEFRSIPVALDGEGNLTLIMSDPSDTKAAEEISFFTGSYVMRAVATQSQIAWCLAHYYKQETPLYQDLVADGVWPESEPTSAPAQRAPEQETAPMKTRPRTVKRSKKEGSAPKDKKEKTTGPLKTRIGKRPANQHPSPPELLARAGEIESVAKPEREMDEKPGVEVFLEEGRSGVVQTSQRGTDTAPILLSSLKADESGPIVLSDSDRKRRVSRQTNLGVGIASSESSPIQKALAAHAESGPVAVPSVDPEAPAPDAMAGKLKPASDAESARSVDLVGGDWGEPGTTIPPNYLGARDIEDSVPVAIDDSEAVTSQINVGEQSIPVEVAPSADQTDRTPPRREQQASPAMSTSKLLSALRTIDGAHDKRGILDPILTFLDGAYERTGFLALRQDELSTWLLHGCMDDAQSSLSATGDDTLSDVVKTQLPYNGPISDQSTKKLARDLDTPDALDLLALPVTIRKRVVGVIFGLGSYEVVSEEHLTILIQAIGEAFERLLLERK